MPEDFDRAAHLFQARRASMHLLGGVQVALLLMRLGEWAAVYDLLRKGHQDLADQWYLCGGM